MKILLTGATGYIGKRLLPALLDEGHEVTCCVRDRNRFEIPEHSGDRVKVVEADFLDSNTLGSIPSDIDAAYYLIHSMSSSATDFVELEERAAENFRDAIGATNVKHVIYLGGIVNVDALSKHLESRKRVGEILRGGDYAFTGLRAGIIVGSGSASFEIIRDLAEKLPVMIAPKWVNTKCQPIGIRDVIYYLQSVLADPKRFDRYFDIGGPDVLTYREMLLGYARLRRLKRWIWTVPVMTPRLSSYWLYFVTSTSYKLAQALVNSMKIEVVASESDLQEMLDHAPMSYEEALSRTLMRIEQNQVVSSWKDSLSSGRFTQPLSQHIEVPKHGCLFDKRSAEVTDPETTLNRIWSLGGTTGWYYADGLWKIRGFMDKLVGGVGLRRGRTHPHEIHAGDSLDFWRVLYANKDEQRLLLFAEMKVPGEAWLEFKIRNGVLYQTATFRPRGLWGRVYWFLVWPLHGIVFGGMLRKLSA